MVISYSSEGWAVQDKVATDSMLGKRSLPAWQMAVLTWPREKEF